MGRFRRRSLLQPLDRIHVQWRLHCQNECSSDCSDWPSASALGVRRSGKRQGQASEKLLPRGEMRGEREGGGLGPPLAAAGANFFCHGYLPDWPSPCAPDSPPLRRLSPGSTGKRQRESFGEGHGWPSGFLPIDRIPLHGLAVGFCSWSPPLGDAKGKGFEEGAFMCSGGSIAKTSV